MFKCSVCGKKCFENKYPEIAEEYFNIRFKGLK